MVRRTSDFAIVAVAVMVNLAERTGAIAAATVALAGVADRVVLADPELTLDRHAPRTKRSTRPRPGSPSASSRRTTCTRRGSTGAALARVLTARALREACARAAGAAV